ncbi:MAG: hypothetical protein Q9173_007176 [Seirophora scorigena]
MSKPEWPNFGLCLAWWEPERLSTWLRPTPLSLAQLVRSLVYGEYKTRRPEGRAPPSLTYGPESFVGKTNVSVDARFIVRQYVRQGRYRIPAGRMVNEEMAAVFKLMNWAGHTATEIALTICYSNGNLGHLRLTNCTGTFILQRELWTADA